MKNRGPEPAFSGLRIIEMFSAKISIFAGDTIEMAEIRQAQRIQTSVLAAGEKKLLVWLAERMPSWVTSDVMTGVGLAGSIMTAAGFIMSNLGVGWLWLAIGGFVLNWFGDSLDGTIARVRNAQRPVYGYYIDHTMDMINELLMFVGVGLSPWVHLHIALGALVFYLILTVNQNMNVHLRSEFNLTYAKMGPTEFRLIMIVICLLFICIKPIREYTGDITILGITYTFTLFDYIAGGVTAILAAIVAVNWIQDIRYYARQDPPKEGN